MAPMLAQAPPDVPLSESFEVKGGSDMLQRPLTTVLGGSFRRSVRPEQILLGTLGNLGFRFIKPITVQLENRETEVVASWPEIDEFGTGTSMSSATEDLGRTVAELYRTLKNDQDNLGPDLERVWLKLQEHVVPRR